MDRSAARIVNALLGNEDASPVLEFHFPAPEIEFDTTTTIAIGGADFGARIEETEIRNWSTRRVLPGEVLKFAKPHSGNRAYLAVPGGLAADRWLGSASTNLAVGIGGCNGRKLAPGDRLECEGRANVGPLTVGRSLVPRYSRYPTVRVVPGNEFEHLTAADERVFISEGFTLTNDCDRMGFRLSGKALHMLDDRQMVSAAVSCGTIQLLPDGQIIVLMADHQTSGGYPRIASVISADLPLLAQCGPGDGVSFQMVSIADAERLALEFDAELNLLRAGCRLQGQC